MSAVFDTLHRPSMLSATSSDKKNKTRANKPAQYPSYLQRVIETMARVRSEREQGVFAFTAPNRGAGTSYVINLLATELAKQFDCTVAVIPTEAIKGADPRKLPQGYIEHAPKIWTAVPDRELEQMPDFALENVWISTTGQNFDFVLVDCPALAGNSQALRWTAAADGVFLIVEAGVTQISQIESAQRMLHTANSRFEGIVINRRTYPIPKFVYQLL